MIGDVALALLPIILLIALGRVLHYRAFVAESFWPQADRIGFFVLLPCLLFHGLATAQLQLLPVGTLIATMMLSTLPVALLLIALQPLTKMDGPAFTSVFQGAVRFNNYVGVTLAAGLFGAQGIALAAVCTAAAAPIMNVLCVLVFARFGTAKLSGRALLKQVTLNPLVTSSLAGIAFQMLGLSIPPGVEPAVKALGAASLPLGLICIGAALDFRTARQWVGPVISSSFIKFLALPLVTATVAILLELEGPALTTALLFQVLPTASSAYIMARQLGGNAPLMAGITATQTVLAIGAIPLVLGGLAAWVLP